MSVADTSHSDTTPLAQSGKSAITSCARAARDPNKPESRACVLHICGGVAMLIAGVALLIIT